MTVDELSWVGLTLAAGRYSVLSLLGEGGMGAVYKARDNKLDTDVVVKVPKPSLLARQEFAARFAREIRSLVRLAHAHIVRILEVGEHDRVPFVVLQYLGGGSLRDRLTRSDPSGDAGAALVELLTWLPGVADALDYIHGQGYVHRDVKPDNILFDANGAVYLGDFGIAKALAAEAKGRTAFETSDGVLVGTPEYVAPELVTGQGCSGSVDQYALAVTVFEMVCGRLPFQAEAATAVMVQHATQPPPDPQELARGIPPAFAAALLRGLSKEPSQRYADCRALAQALRATLPARQAGRGGATPVPKVAPPSGSSVGKATGPEFPCPACGTVFRLPPSPEGKHLRCRHCNADFIVPSVLPGIAAPRGTPAPSSGELPAAPDPSGRPTSYPCPACGKVFAVPERMWGKTVRCKRCQAQLVLPATPGHTSTQPDTPLPLAVGELPPRGDRSWSATARNLFRGAAPRRLYLLGGTAALVALAVVLAVMFWPGNSPSRKYQSGMKALRSYELDRAISLFKEAIAADPSDPDAYCGLSEAYFRSSEYNQAIDTATEAIKRATGGNKVALARAYAWRGGAYNRLGDVQHAIDDCSEALRLDDQLAVAWAFRGDSYGNQGDFEKAIRDSSRAIEIDPQEALAYLARSDAYGDMGELDRAIADAGRAVELAPKMGLAYAYRGARYGQQEKYDKALADMDQALTLAPREAEIYNSRAIIYAHKGQHDLAIPDFSRAIELAPRFAEIYANRSSSNLARRELDRALQDVNEAIRLSPRSAPCHTCRGLYYLARNDPNQAIADFREAIRLNPRYAEAYRLRAAALCRVDKVDQALADLDEAIKIQPGNPQLYLTRGEVYLQRKHLADRAAGDLDQAVQLAGRASMKETAAQALVLRAEVRARQKRFADALADCQGAIDAAPQNASAFAERGWVRTRASIGKNSPEMLTACDEALADCEKALSLDRDLALAYRVRCYALVLQVALANADTSQPATEQKLQQARQDVERAIALDSTDAWAYWARSALYKVKGDVARAEADYSRAVQLEPTLASPSTGRNGGR